VKRVKLVSISAEAVRSQKGNFDRQRVVAGVGDNCHRNSRSAVDQIERLQVRSPAANGRHHQK
jgi:hypothetical protein